MNNITFGKRAPIQEKAYQPPEQPVAPLYGGPDRRCSARRKMLKTCKLVFNDRFSVFDGVMVDKSENGAKLKVKNPAYIANEFLLRTVFGNSQFVCSVMWRNREFIGVQFEEF